MKAAKKKKNMNEPSFTSENVPGLYRTSVDYAVPSDEERIGKAEKLVKDYLATAHSIADIDTSVILRAVKADEAAILSAIAAQQPSHNFNDSIIASEHEAELARARSKIAEYDILISKLEARIDKLQHIYDMFN